MPILIGSLATHACQPLWMEPAKGFTAEYADGVETGYRGQHNTMHMLHYRYGGPQSLSHMRGAANSGTIWVIIDYPTRRDTATQNMFCYLCFRTSGTGGYTIEWRDSFGSGGYTTLVTTTASVDEITTEERFTVAFQPPTSASNNQKVIEIKYTNLYPRNFSTYIYGDKYVPLSNAILSDSDCNVGTVIRTGDSSFGGLMKSIGMGDEDVESMERLTRRTFFNSCHPDGSFLDFSEGAGYNNMFTEHQFYCAVRDLAGVGSGLYSHPAAVIMCNGHDQEGEEIKLRFEGQTSSNSWVYSVQADDPVDTPFFVNQWTSPGSSSADGLELYAEDVEIQGSVTTGSTLTLLAWGLFEGANY